VEVRGWGRAQRDGDFEAVSRLMYAEIPAVERELAEAAEAAESGADVGAGGPMVKEEVGPDDVLVRVKACAICGSDVHGFTGKTGRRLPPLIMGHEAAGVVEATGRNATAFQPGDRVSFDSTVYCNHCPACTAGLFNRCQSRQVLGVSIPEFKRHGAMAEYVAVPSWIAFKISDDLAFTHAALLEPASIAVHAANRSAVQQGDTVLVVGAGTIGLLAIQAARLKGARTVIACDLNDFRLRIAKAMGADVTVNTSGTDALAQILGHTEGRGVDVSFEAVGLPETFRLAASALKLGGQVVAIGNVRRDVEINLQELVSRELTFTGSYASSGELRSCADLIATGRIRVEPLISEVLHLKDGPKAFERLLKAEEDLIKIVLEP
jgi:L-iditol 2-dehydrogenase